ncbi:MAG: exonuclease domain-containing protein [Gammaproteobacteria bacterium]|nr:exonuclease domain-containing protein [Gammaproteobacteria bacterium]
MLSLLLSLESRRIRAIQRAPAGPLRDYFSVPFPSRNADYREVPFVAVDLETTGLDARRDEIVAVGLVHFTASHIELASARHWLVTPTGAIPEASAVIHCITDDKAAVGQPLDEVLAEVLPQLAGRVLVAHHAQVELQFLKAACATVYGEKLIIPAVDTQALEQRRLDRWNQAYKAKELRLAVLRRRYNLPRYRAHNALSDALAAAELFLAQLAEVDLDDALPLKRFLLQQ